MACNFIRRRVCPRLGYIRDSIPGATARLNYRPYAVLDLDIAWMKLSGRCRYQRFHLEIEGILISRFLLAQCLSSRHLLLMGWSLQLGRFAGTNVRIHFTFLIFLAWIGYDYYRQG